MVADSDSGQQAKRRRPTHLPPVETRWKPGQSGNPNGTRVGAVNLLDRIRKKLQEQLAEGADRQIADEAADAYVKAMAGGSIKHAQDFLDRDEGKAALPIELAGELSITNMTTEEASQLQAQLLARAGLSVPELAVAGSKRRNGNGNGKR